MQINARSAADGLTVDLSQMRGVVVDPVQQTAVVQGADSGFDYMPDPLCPLPARPYTPLRLRLVTPYMGGHVWELASHASCPLKAASHLFSWPTSFVGQHLYEKNRQKRLHLLGLIEREAWYITKIYYPKSFVC